MPRSSRYRAALDDDDEYAELALILHDDEEEAAPSVPLAGYDEHTARLDNIFDAVNLVAEILQAVYSSKKSSPRPNRAPRPQTAVQRLRHHRVEARLQSIEDKMLGR